MADDKKNIGPEVEKTDAPPAPDQPAPGKAEPIVADPAPAEKAAPVDKAEPTVPEVPGPASPEPPKPGKEAGKNKAPPKQKTTEPKDKAAAKASKGRPSKADKAAPDKAKPPTRDKMSQSKAAPENAAPNPQEAPAPAAPEQPAAPRDATRAEKEEIVYLNLADLHPFKNHPFGVRDDAEMQGLVESVKAAGVNQPALVRSREDGGYMDKNQGYEIIKAVMLENGRGFALGHHPTAPSPYVTWACYDDKDGQRQYEWGHYGSDRAALEQDFAARVQEYQRLYNVGVKQTEAPGLYKYYSTQRPVNIGTFPKPPRNAPDEIVNYDQRVPVENGSFLAWGHLTYTRPLTKRQASDYELRPAPDNPDRPRSIREQMKTAAKQAEADRGQAAPKKNAPDRGER